MYDRYSTFHRYPVLVRVKGINSYWGEMVILNKNTSQETRVLLLLAGSYVALGIALIGIAQHAKRLICQDFYTTPLMTIDQAALAFFVFLACLLAALYSGWEVRWKDKHKFMVTTVSYCSAVLILILSVCAMSGITPIEIIEGLSGTYHSNRTDLMTGMYGPRLCRVSSGGW